MNQPASATPRFPLVQMLRAVAALVVAAGHVLHDAAGLPGGAPSWIAAASGALPWHAGVDIFFVISGFVIVHASARLFGGGWPAARRFLVRRLGRIVPLYWAATALFLMVQAASPGAVHGALGGVGWVAASFLFLPWPRPDGLVQPVFGLGWTLNYEMLFYAVFALCVPLRRPAAIAAAVLALGLLVALAQVTALPGPLAFWSDPIVLEFLFGVLLAGSLPLGWRLRGGARLALAAFGAALFCLDLSASLPRPLAFGLPALLLVAAAVLGRPGAALPAAERVAVLLGDASYAIYLTHPFPMRALAIVWPRLHLPAGLYPAVALAAILAVGLAVHVAVERPLMRRLRR